jgi:hypothetical protein
MSKQKERDGMFRPPKKPLTEYEQQQLAMRKNPEKAASRTPRQRSYQKDE